MTFLVVVPLASILAGCPLSTSFDIRNEKVRWSLIRHLGHVAHHPWVIQFIAIFVHHIVADDALAVGHLCILSLTSRKIVMTVGGLQEVVHMCSGLSRSCCLLSAPVGGDAPGKFICVLKGMAEVFIHGLRAWAVEVRMSWVSSVNVVLVCHVTSFVHRIRLVASGHGVLAHAGHSLRHILASSCLLCISSSLILHTDMLWEPIVFLLARAEVVWDQGYLMCRGGLRLELRIVLPSMDSDKV